MIGVEKIGEIRRAYFEQHRSIKEIVRTLSVSRATVRKVVRGHQTEFKYERGVQPSPKLGAWVEVLTQILEQEAKLPKRERRSTQRLFEELRGRGYDGAHDSVHRFVKAYRANSRRRREPTEIANVPPVLRQNLRGNAGDGEVGDAFHCLSRIGVTTHAVRVEKVALLRIGDDVDDFFYASFWQISVEKVAVATPLRSAIGRGGFWKAAWRQMIGF